MNWSNAKTILIIALVITDIFLFFTYGKFNFRSEEFKDTKALAEFLARKSIYVDEAVIPTKHEDMPVLFVHGNETEHDKVNALLKDKEAWRAEAEDSEAYKRAADTFIKAAGHSHDTTVFEKTETSGDTVKVVYKNVIKKIPIEKSQMICEFQNQILTKFDCHWLEAVKFHNKKQKTISASQALLMFMIQNEDKKNIHIDSVEMIYWLDESVNVEMPVSADTAFPTWKIVYSGASAEQGGEAAYIDAYEHR